MAPGARAWGRWVGRGAQAQAHVVTRARTFAEHKLAWNDSGSEAAGEWVGLGLRLKRWRKAGAMVCRAVIAAAVGRRV